MRGDVHSKLEPERLTREPIGAHLGINWGCVGNDLVTIQKPWNSRTYEEAPS